jgi:hypothetical protein
MMSRLNSILERLELSSLESSFTSNGITDDILYELTDEDLKGIGISGLGDRKRILKAFRVEREQSSSEETNPLPSAPIDSKTVIIFESPEHDILITNKKVQVGGKTFNSNKINSFEVKRTINPRAVALGAKIFIYRLLGRVMVAIAILGFIGNVISGKPEGIFFTFIFALIIVPIGLLLINKAKKNLDIKNSLPPTAIITFMTSSGESKLKMTSYDIAMQFSNALEDIINQ